MKRTVEEVLEFVEENDVKFIRLAFCDLLGKQKNISITAGELPRAFEEGIRFDAWGIDGFWDGEHSDLLVVPEPDTLCVLPWRPQQSSVVRLYCTIRYPDGTPFICDGRTILQNSIESLKSYGYACQIGTECEFYLLKTDENGHPTKEPLDLGSYFDVAPLDKGENIRREICLCLEEMGLHPETSNHEQGPGQNKIDFKFSDTLTSADNFLTFKNVVSSIAARNGLAASFLPKPFANESGNGLHMHISLVSNNILAPKSEEQRQKDVDAFIAGIMNRIREITMFLNTTSNSYERLGTFEAPKYVSWSKQNRAQLISIPASRQERLRFELRSPDPSLNPYIAFALIIAAGMEGIKKGLELSPETQDNLIREEKTEALNLEKLPATLKEAAAIAFGSDFVKEIIGEQGLKQYILIAKREWERTSSN
ncbi:MAG: glutamine synthetase family protein [Eubacteriales bacterium]